MSVSPDEIPLCILIHYFVTPPIKDDVTNELFEPLGTSKQIAIFLLRELTHVTSATYTELSTLLVSLREQVVPAGEQLVRHVVENLQELESPDDMGKLFTTLSACLLSSHPPDDIPPTSPISGVGGGSVMGLFLRRCRVNFARMSYEAVGQLWREVQQRLLQALDLLAGIPRPTLRPIGALHAFLESTQLIVDRNGSNLPIAAVEHQLAEFQGQVGAIPGVLLVRLKTALRHRDHHAALHALHRYFDLNLHHTLSNPYSLDATKERANNALLLLSSTEAEMGNAAGALLALNEALHTAQQQRDAPTLGHALAELCRVMPAAGVLPTLLHEPGGERKNFMLLNMLSKCLSKGRQLHLPHLAAFARIALARFHLERQLDPPPSWGLPPADEAPSSSASPSSTSTSSMQLVQQQLREVSALQAATTLAAATGSSAAPPPPRPPNGGPPPMHRPISTELYSSDAPVFSPALSTPSAQAASMAAVQQHAGQAHLVASAAWSAHGNASLAHTHSLTALALYSAQAAAVDRAVAFAQLADETLRKQGLAAARQVLDAAEVAPHTHPALMMAHHQWQHRAQMHLGQQHFAEAAADAMRGLGGPGGQEDPLLRLQAAKARAENLAAAGNAEGAYRAASSLFTHCCQLGMQVEAAHALLLLAKIHSQFGSPFSALPPLLSCLLHAQHLDLAMLVAEAAVQLAVLLLALLPPQRALFIDLLEEQLPLILAHGSVELQAEAQWSMAGAFLEGCESQEEVVANWGWVRTLLLQAREGFEKAELGARAEEVMVLLAAGYDVVGDVAARDNMSDEVVAAGVKGGWGRAVLVA